ncbi:MAG TPA: glycosyltransferase family 39 protein [Chloroflexia bacterium]|nr:glycosyltransferase family 39 protein [Chloroflexia bacterium]
MYRALNRAQATAKPAIQRHRLARGRLLLGLSLALALGFGLLLYDRSQPDLRLDLSRDALSPALQGFYNPERNEVFSYRWSKPTWELDLAGLAPQPYTLYLGTLRPDPQPVRVVDKLSGRTLTTFTPTGQWQTVRLALAAETIREGRLNLAFNAPAMVPASPAEKRLLGVMVTDIELKPADRPDLALPGFMLIVGAGLVGLFLFAPALLKASSACFAPTEGATYPLISPTVPVSATHRPALNSLLNGAGWGLAGVGLAALLLRSANLLSLSIFVDESFHIGAGLAAQNGSHDTTGLFSLAIDSKILHGWLLAAIFQVAGTAQLLWVTRLFSALCGLLTALACYGLALRLFASRRAGLLAAALWALLPYATWHERLALVDPLLTTCATTALYFSVRLLEATNRKAWAGYGLLAGIALAAALLTKITALALLGMPLLALLLLYPRGEWPRLGRRCGAVYLGLWLAAAPVIGLYNGLWNGGQQADKLQAPGPALFFNNSGQVAQWLYAYCTPPLLLTLLAASGYALWQKRRASLFLLAAALLPLLLFCATSRVIYPRYFLFCLPPLVVLAAGGLATFLQGLAATRRLRLASCGLALLVLPALWLDFQMVVAPEKAPLPPVDRFQYIEGWPAGGQVEQLAAFLSEQQQAGGTVTVLDLDYISAQALKVYLLERPAMNLLSGAGVAPTALEPHLKNGLARGPTFLVIDNPKDASALQSYRWVYPQLEFQPVRTIERPGQQYQLVIYRLRSKAP